MKLQNKLQDSNKNISFTKTLFYTGIITCTGLLSGIAIKFLDIYTTNLGNIFSQMSVWIFLCTILAIYSSTPKRAAINVFLFCFGMVSTYYLTAKLTKSVYSSLFLYGWMIFNLFTPFMAFGTWYTLEKGIVSKLIILCIILILFVTAYVLFDKIRISDIVFAILTYIVIIKRQKYYKF